MIAKLFEIRDKATFIPILAVKMAPANESERYLLGCAGYGTTAKTQSQYVQLVRINGGDGESHCSPYDWGNNTLVEAHKHIEANFDDMEEGAVVDVEYITGQTQQPKISQRITTHDGC